MKDGNEAAGRVRPRGHAPPPQIKRCQSVWAVTTVARSPPYRTARLPESMIQPDNARLSSSMNGTQSQRNAMQCN